MGSFIDITGQRFGRLVVLRREGSNGRHITWLCRCDCGTVRPFISHLIRYGHTTSCGCIVVERAAQLRRSHGRSSTRTYRIWKGMRRRCQVAGNSRWDYYGARGIQVSDRWDNFEAFFEDMGECPSGMSLERIDNDKGYEPGNCRWATLKEQARNQRTNRLIECRGELRCLAEWSEITGLHRTVIFGRLKRGWPPERAIFEPKR